MEEIAVLDFETTGLAPARHRVIEVSVVIVQGSVTSSTTDYCCGLGSDSGSEDLEEAVPSIVPYLNHTIAGE
jgi:DNA polymerase III epsilon subunit-like protein